MKIKILFCVVVAMAISTLQSCDNDDDNNNVSISDLLTKVSVASTDDFNYTIQLYSIKTPVVGYNKLYFSIQSLQAKQNVTNASVMLYPEMDMTTMKHSAPVEQPTLSSTYKGVYEAAIVFIMPSGDAGSWSVRVAFDIDGAKDTVVLNVPTVELEAETKLYSFVSALNQKKYFMSLIEPLSPKVGINDFDITIHEKKSMMSFPAVNDLTIEIEPEMPSMDHGSPNNVNPIFLENGHYSGNVNFTMTGWWRVNITIKSGDDIITESAYLDITF